MVPIAYKWYLVAYEENKFPTKPHFKLWFSPNPEGVTWDNEHGAENACAWISSSGPEIQINGQTYFFPPLKVERLDSGHFAIFGEAYVPCGKSSPKT